MQEKNRAGRYSVLKSFFLSYLLILMVPIFFGAAIYLQAEKIIEDEINNSNTVMLEQSRQALDVALEDMNRLISQITINKRFRALIGIEKRDLTNVDYYNVFQSVSDYQYYKVFTSYMEDYVLYLNKIDKVLSGQGLLDPNIYFHGSWMNSSYYDGMSYEQWLEMMKGRYSGKFVKLNVSGGLQNEASVLYTLLLPVNDQKNPDASILIRLNSKKITETIQNKLVSTGRSVIILDDDNNVLFSAGDDLPPAGALEYGSFAGDKGMSHLTFGQKIYVVSHTSSKIVRWKYISITPFNAFWAKVEFIRLLTLLAMGLCLLLGLAGAYLLSRRNYLPIKDLLGLLGKRLNQEPGKHGNEFKIIKDAVSETIDENEAIASKLRIQNQALRSNYLAKLLKGKLDDAEDIARSLQALDIAFFSDHFLVMLFYIKDHGDGRNLPESMNEDARSKTPAVLCEVLRDLFGKGAQGKVQIHMTEPDDLLCFILNLESPEPDWGAIVGAACEAHDFMLAHSGVRLAASISESHETVHGIAAAYQEALDAMEYGLLALTGTQKSIIPYEDIKNLDSRYHYSLDTEKRLANFIKAGDLLAGTHLLEEIFKTNLVDRQLSANTIKSLMLDLNNTILKALSEAGAECDAGLFREINITEKLMRSEHLDDMKFYLTEAVQKVCAMIKSGKKTRRDQIITEISAYVKENFSDKNLCIPTIGELFRLNAAYVAKLFKEQTGEYLNDYIGRVRMEKAKELLKDNGLSIKEIADRVGYFSSNVFIKAFKKHEGITPGMYRGIR